jgi:protein phosphatase
MNISIPEFCLVLLIGPSGSGKSTFAKSHFKATEVISSDFCRGLVSDDENDQSATGDAFELVHFIAAKRLAARRLTVIDATNVRPEDRKKLINLAKQYHALTAGIVFLLPERLCHERNKDRPDRNFGPHVVRNQLSALKRSHKRLNKEGMRYVFRLNTPEEVRSVSITRQRLWTDRRDERGQFDIIGDVHGCADELEKLMESLGYRVAVTGSGTGRRYDVTPPDGRKAIFLGDLVDRGPRVPDVLRLVKSMVDAGTAICIMGNHENKLLRKLNGRNVTVNHGLAETMEQLDAEPSEFVAEMRRFIDGLISHYVLDDGRLVVAHAGIREDMQGRSSGAVRAFCLYGDSTGEIDEFGLPVRHDWASDYRGNAKVVYGHTPVPEVEWLNGTACIDTGCVFGGKLTALRYPELDLVQVPAAKVYMEPARPLAPVAERMGAQQEHDRQLDLADVSGKCIITSALQKNVTIREENAAAALEAMSRFAVDPRWLIYLPPTMSPSETSTLDPYLEHPTEALAYFRNAGIGKVVCEEKHMGSRAVLVVCRDGEAACRRFGIESDNAGIVYTRTGRPFFNDPALERGVLDRVRDALDRTEFWSRFESDWVCLDAEIMPWSLKAQALLDQQYAPVGAAARIGLGATTAAIGAAHARGLPLEPLLDRFRAKESAAADYREAYRPYCWPVNSVDDIKVAPFHLMAAEGHVFTDKNHDWHMRTLAEICAAGNTVLHATARRTVDLHDDAAIAEAIAWWVELTENGGEGMVVKPMEFISRAKKGLAQPALKCRGARYLRIIYGPEYDLPDNLTRLRQRGLNAKRSLALREFALGLEALDRFVRKEPLRRVHECVFGVLALESEPVDPRL